MSDPFQEQEWLDYAERAMSELVPKLQDVAVVVSLLPKGPTDIKFALELGLSIMLDKPIIAIVAPGSPVPAKVVAVADAIVEGHMGDPGFEDRFHAVLDRVMKGRDQ